MLAGYGAALLHALDFAVAGTMALEALELARRAGAHTVEARILAVVGFSSAYLDDAGGGVGGDRRGPARGGAHG